MRVVLLKCLAMFFKKQDKFPQFIKRREPSVSLYKIIAQEFDESIPMKHPMKLDLKYIFYLAKDKTKCFAFFICLWKNGCTIVLYLIPKTIL